MKKIICIILTVLMLVSVSGISVSAAQKWIAATGDDSGTIGDCTWEYISSDKTMRISGHGAMADYSEKSQPPFLMYDIETIIIDDGVTHIGDRSFAYATSLKQLSIADSVKSIGVSAFAFCTGLRSLTLPKNLETIGEEAFFGCDRIGGELVIPDNVEEISKQAFRACKSLKKLTLGEKTEFVDEAAFMDCFLLEKIDCKNLMTISDYGFKNCLEMQEVNISSVQVIGKEAFANNLVLSIVETSPDLFLAMGAFKNSQIQAIVFFSRMCVLENDTFGADSIPEKTIIVGYKGSSAERYATKYNREFYEMTDNDTVIKKVELNVTDPVAGKKPSYEATVPSAYANQYQIDDFSFEDGTWTHGIAWYDTTEGRRITPDETFKGGHAYEVCAYLTPKQGYRFYFSQTGTAGGTINGRTAKFEYNKPDTRNPMIFYDYDALEVTYTDLSELNLSLTPPAFHAAPATEAQTTTEGVTVSGVSWSGLSEGGTFDAGTAYTATISIAAEEGYRITADATAEINDENAVVKVAEDGLTATVSYTFAPLEDPRQAIGSIALTVNAPVSDETPIDRAQTDTDGVRIDGVKWSVVENDTPVQMEQGAVFEAGKVYAVTVTVSADDDHIISETLTASVNGESASVVPDEDLATCTVTYTFPALPDKAPGALLGDVDGDGVVNIFDASAIQKHIASMPVPSFNDQAADVDGDGVITIFDASLIQKYVAGTPIAFPINQPLT